VHAQSTPAQAAPAPAQVAPAQVAPAPVVPAPAAPAPAAPAPAHTKRARAKPAPATPVPAQAEVAPPAAQPAPVVSPAVPEATPLVVDPNAPVTAPSDQEQERNLDTEARERFELGRTFYEAGRFQQAAEEFAEAYKLSGRPQLLYNLYVANRDAGNWQMATDSLRGYLDKVPDAPDRITLNARLEALEAQNAVRKKEQAEAEEARRRNAVVITRPVRVRSNIPWIIASSGGALLAGSIITGVMAKSKDDDLDKVCADGGKICPEWQRSNATKAYALAITTDVLWTVGAAAAVTGLVLWYSGALDTKKDVPVASFGVTQHGLSGSLTVRY
jgi:tetratricopeptide (TPR) repeat protein